MKKIILLAVICLYAVPCSAQQQSPSNIAIQVTNVVNSMALELERDRQAIQDLQKQLADAQAKLKEHEKVEEKK